MTGAISILTYILFITISWTELAIGPLRISELLILTIIFLWLFSEGPSKARLSDYRVYATIFMSLFIYAIIVAIYNAITYTINDNPLSFYSFYLSPLYRFPRYATIIIAAIIIITFLKHERINKRHLSYAALSSIYIPAILHTPEILSRDDFYRETLFCIEPSEAAFYTTTLTLFAIYINRRITPIALISLILLLVIKSSGTFMAIGAATTIYLITTALRNRRNMARNIGFSILIFWIAFIFHDQTIGYVQQKIIAEGSADTNTSIVERTAALNASIKMFIDHPFGVGIGNYGWLIDEYNSDPRYITVAHGSFHANSALAFVLSDLGIAGAIFMLFFLVTLIKNSLTNESQLIALSGLYIALSSPNFMILNNILTFIIFFMAAQTNLNYSAFINNKRSRAS